MKLSVYYTHIYHLVYFNTFNYFYAVLPLTVYRGLYMHGFQTPSQSLNEHVQAPYLGCPSSDKIWCFCGWRVCAGIGNSLCKCRDGGVMRYIAFIAEGG
jgi:hypothetical protein